MAAPDATILSKRLSGEAQEYWMHLDATSPLEKYPAKQHARRVQQKLGVEDGLVYLLGQPTMTNEDSDMLAPFRQRRYFYYLSGCNEPDCHLTYDIRRDKLTLYLPRADPWSVIYNGRGSNPAEAIEKYDINEAYYVDKLYDHLQAWTNCSNKDSFVYVLHPSQAPTFPDLALQFDFATLQPAANFARMIKDDHEVALIRKANDISSEAHTKVMQNILRFSNEAQVEGLFLDVCISKQAREQAYDPIVASGINAGTLHYSANNEDFGDRQLLCIDAGCEFDLYASDVTRTFPLSGTWPSKESHDIYKLVERMQEACIERLAPGVRYFDLHVLAHQIAIDGLLELGILQNGTREEIYKAGTSRAFFPHGLGHHVGLEVHDVGQANLMSVGEQNSGCEQRNLQRYPSSAMRGRLESSSSAYWSIDAGGYHEPVYDPRTCQPPTDLQSSRLEDGMVVTVEPGIYFSAYALEYYYLNSPIHAKYINVEILQRYMPVGGVRIEDDLLITSKGYENLTTAPKGEAMLQLIRAGRSVAPLTLGGAIYPQIEHTDMQSRIRAPGILPTMAEPLLKPFERALSMPMARDSSKDIDFEPHNGPSLFSNFQRSMTSEEKVERWQRMPVASERFSQPSGVHSASTICGEITSYVQHIYLTACGSGSDSGNRRIAKPACVRCRILCQTLHRLRQNISSFENRPTGGA